MNTIKIYFGTDGQILTSKIDFSLYKGSYENKLVNMYVPKSICSPYFSDDDGIVTGTLVKIASTAIGRGGQVVQSSGYNLNYIKELQYNGVDYLLFERSLPREFVTYSGEVTMLVNVTVVDNSDSDSPMVLSVVTTQQVALTVLESAYIGDEDIIDPTELDVLEATVNSLIAKVGTADLEAMAIYNYDSTFKYGINALTYSIDSDDNAYLYRSLVADNLGNDIDDGDYWERLSKDGANGLDALTYNEIKVVTSTVPSTDAGIVFTTDYANFNRIPMVGNTCLVVWETTSTGASYLCVCTCTELNDEQAKLEITSFVETTGATGATGAKGDKGDTGDAGTFQISIVYSSVAEMNEDWSTDGVPIGGLAVIDTGDVEDPDNAKLYVKKDTGYSLLTDMSGAEGIQGPTGVGIASTVKTSTSGLVDTYTITYTDGDTDTFTVTNGADGTDGANGVEALTYNEVKSVTSTAPSVDAGTTFTTDYTNFNRMPVVGDTCLVVWETTSTGASYLCVCTCTELNDEQAKLEITSFVETTGAQGAQGEQGVAGVDGINATTTEVATTSVNGLMSSTDKIKLDGVAENANATTVVDNVTSTSTTSALSANQGRVLNEKIVTLYRHTIKIYYTFYNSLTSETAEYYDTFSFTDTTGTAYTTRAQVASALYNAGYTYNSTQPVTVSGVYYYSAGGTYRTLVAYCGSSSTLYRVYDLSSASITSSTTVTDTVITL